MTAFGLGVLASVAATAVWGLCARVVIPALRASLSDELDISGSWSTECVTPAGNSQTATMELRQRFRALHGRVMITKRIASSGASETKVYAADGHLRDRFMTLSARSNPKQTIGVFVLLLEVVGDGRAMRGATVWYSATHKTIEHAVAEWMRTGVGSQS